ncbi:WD repeat-containing protein 36 isoform X1 [Dromiciops gliroides]|uniref:WD repeat-containing protein 36 isoform X1 n=1 Tax=Dromiciops gliroides TaxID=33562 RepID=UPI001CC56046|nr:WD repeat-containing protein 36 isoform X1 [Dromiciops gliroides]
MEGGGGGGDEGRCSGSALFSGFRALGLFSSHIPHVVRYHGRHRRFYVTTCVGKSFHTYNVQKLSLVAVSNSVPQDITCLAADGRLVFAAYGNVFSAFSRNKEVTHTFRGHNAEINLLLPFGDHIISIDTDSILIIWHIYSEEKYLQLTFDKAVFKISTILHPSTYLNKILLGSEQGSLQLWNVKSNKLLYTFPGWSVAVTALQQAPAVDVIAVGLVSGQIIIHNIKFNETLMKFRQDWGPVTSISFRTDGHPVMASGSPLGHISLWDLEERKLINQMRNAHSTAIAGLTFLHGEPLLLTNGADNALRIWIFDGTAGEGRLLKFRMGHSAPLTKIRYYGQNGQQILSASHDGTLQSFSTIHEKYNKNLGLGMINKKQAKRKGLKNCESMKLPPITVFVAENARESDWDGIIACHQGRFSCSTWNYQKCTMGAYFLKPENWKKDKLHNTTATAIDITSCGNFAVIGLTSGNVDVYNMQSGMHRGSFGMNKAHEGAVRGVAVDGLNQLTITAGSEGLLKFWNFKSKMLIHTTNLNSSPNIILLHRDSGILGIASDDFSLSVIDIETRRTVREFFGHQGQINDMAFSPDGRWLISGSMDCSIRIWDLPSGCLIDCFLVDSAPVSLTMSPTGDFLATSHVDNLGIYLWSNISLYSLVSLRPLSPDYVPSVVMLPGTCYNEEVELLEEIEGPNDEMIDYDSPEQLNEQLLTLSLLPESRWKNLLNLAVIKKKNKPKEPPKVPKSAPFFIPTVPGLVPKYLSSEQDTNAQQSKVINLGVLAQKSDFCLKLEEGLNDNKYESPLNILKELGPSAIEIELRSLSPECGGSVKLMQSFLKMIGAMLTTKRDFELAQAYLALFLKLHLKILPSEPVLLEEMTTLSSHLEETWIHLQSLFNQSLCVLNFIKSALL